MRPSAVPRSCLFFPANNRKGSDRMRSVFSDKPQDSDISEDITMAKKLYFSNYANYGNMKRNGEFEAYMKYSIPDSLEQEWSRIILDSLLKKIQTGEDIWLVSNLANVRIDESEIIKSFQRLSKSPNVHQIITAVKRSELLIAPRLFKQIQAVLEEGAGTVPFPSDSAQLNP